MGSTKLRADRSLIIGSDAAVADDLHNAVRQVNAFLPVFKLTHWPDAEELGTVLNTQRPSIVFLEVENIDAALAIRERIRDLSRGTQIVAFSRNAGEGNLLRLMRAGVNEWLQTPFLVDDVRACMARAIEALTVTPPAWHLSGHVFSFLPAKPGSGASTMALNLAAAIARASDARVALLDFDLNCGILGFLLKTSAGLSVSDAAENSERLDQDVWQQMISKVGNLDLLLSGVPRIGFRIEASQVQRILTYAQSHYPVTCVDLSGNMELYSIEVMRRSTAIFQVCTLDLASLHLARRNLEILDGLGLRDRVQTVVNRALYRGGLTARAVCECLDVKEFITIPNSYSELEAALDEGRPLGSESVVGAGFDKVAHNLLGIDKLHSPAAKPTGGLSFSELRSIASAFRFRGRSKRLPPVSIKGSAGPQDT